jgi:hypothetical protein
LTKEFKSRLQDSIASLEKWVERHDYKAWEPFDGLSSPFRVFTFGNLFLDRVLMQVVRRCPINIRPLLAMKPLPSTKGRGYMAGGYLEMFKITGDESYKTRAFAQLDWLDKNKSPKYQDHSWANHFAFASRGGRYPEHESIIVWTVLIGFVYIEAYELFKNSRHLEIIESITRWILALPREKTSSGTCISYLMPVQNSIHNSNMFGAAFLAHAAKITGNADAASLAREAMLYSCSRQLPDGSWWYGEHPKYHWIDNFHTGYNLDCLKRFIEASGENEYTPRLKTGIEFLKKNFFEPDGMPKYYNNATYPVDSQCAAQAIESLASYADLDPETLPLACKVADWWITNMQDRDGHFYFRMYESGVKDKTPMLHWAQATTYKGLTLLLSKL